ncbi:hypothetical protein LOC67_22965 [Stieleria sp. JC731]|uniref:hypothetical protein n=1 Tax=Pirellulaceae TaxID=2691357 RepID=UPI001E51F705|nr:hypothetical protein [Stieleria sp. JC731]MCC9603420.1 hypothetical protein [Stieleria sp. JC731]
MRFQILVVFVAGYLASMTSGALVAQEDWDERFMAQAKRYEITIRDSKEKCELLDRPILNYTNPARLGNNGAVFLWTHDSVPMVVGTCFTYVYRDRTNRKNAFNVLTDKPIKATITGETVWTPPQDSLQLKPIPGAPTPAGNQRLREVQARSLSRQFSLAVTNRDGSVEQCRLMAKPLYTYESEHRSGSLFSFAVGTDPEAILVIETTKKEGQEPQWSYAWARFTFYALSAKHKQAEVWRVESSENLLGDITLRPDYQQERYVTFRAEHLD